MVAECVNQISRRKRKVEAIKHKLGQKLQLSTSSVRSIKRGKIEIVKSEDNFFMKILLVLSVIEINASIIHCVLMCLLN